MRLLDFASNTHSQTGEDGVIAKILTLLPKRDKWCVEFGAWDGEHLSNTCSLIQRSDYAAVLIEASSARFVDLVARCGQNSKVIPINRFVGFSSTDNLDTILSGTSIPKDFDLLSIDIDGNDYHVWKAVTAYKPKIVCIEYNPTISTEVDFVQPADPALNHGASLRAFDRLGREKGYALVCVTSLNAIFVSAEYFAAFGIADNSPQTLREDVSSVAHIFSGYDGTILMAGAAVSPWHEIRYRSRIRQLPAPFNIYPGNFSRIRGTAFRAYRKVMRMFGRA